MTYAYDELYVLLAQRVLGDMYDYAVNTLGIKIEQFQQMFLVSSIAKQIAIGNPTYIAGMNGCEVAKNVIEECTGTYPETEDEMYLDKSVEYWIGWSLAYYQWISGKDFKTIERACPIDTLYGMYATLHEADISLFVETMNEKCEVYLRESRLRRLRKYAELTQKELAIKADVPLRQIQLFEQGYRDIGKCQVNTLINIAGALHCSVEELV